MASRLFVQVSCLTNWDFLKSVSISVITQLGIGPRLLLLTQDGSCRSHSDVLTHHSIHGIRCDGAWSHVAVFGQKAVTIVTIDHKTFRLVYIITALPRPGWNMRRNCIVAYILMYVFYILYSVDAWIHSLHIHCTIVRAVLPHPVAELKLWLDIRHFPTIFSKCLTIDTVYTKGLETEITSLQTSQCDVDRSKTSVFLCASDSRHRYMHRYMHSY